MSNATADPTPIFSQENVKMLEEDRRIDQDALVLKGIDYYSTVGRKLRSALQIDTTDEDKLSKLIEQAILAGLLIDSQSR